MPRTRILRSIELCCICLKTPARCNLRWPPNHLATVRTCEACWELRSSEELSAERQAELAMNQRAYNERRRVRENRRRIVADRDK